MISPDVQSNVDIWPNDPKVHRRGTKTGLKLRNPKTKSLEPPRFGGRNPKTPKVVRVETLFYVAIDVSIDEK